MTNEGLIRRYYADDEAALDKLYRRNLGLIRSIAKEAASEFNCLHMARDRPEEFSSYAKTILDDLCGEGALEFLTRLQSREYDESRVMLTAYLYPNLKGRMTRWLERSIGNLALSKDDMEAVRQTQKLYHSDWRSIDEIADEMDIKITVSVVSSAVCGGYEVRLRFRFTDRFTKRHSRHQSQSAELTQDAIIFLNSHILRCCKQ